MVDEPKAADEPKGDDNKETVAKTDYDDLKTRSEKLEKDLEDVRMEVLTPDYMKFLDAKDVPKDKTDDGATDKTISEDTYEKMSKAELFQAAKQAAVDEIRGDLTTQKADAKKSSDERTTREIKTFASSHEDYETFRPIMYGMSLDPKHADASLQQLYDAAKAHVGRIHKDPSAEDKKKSAAASNEKPGGDSSSLEKLASMSNEEIAKEALAEVKEALGDVSL